MATMHRYVSMIGVACRELWCAVAALVYAPELGKSIVVHIEGVLSLQHNG